MKYFADHIQVALETGVDMVDISERISRLI